MPILARETDVYPDDLFEKLEQSIEPGASWFALYTMSRQEKELMRRLRGLDIAFYCPLVARRTRSPAGRIRISHVPVFSNYVFMYGSEEARYRAMTTNCISRCLLAPDARRLTYELQQVRKLVATNAPLTPEARLEPGMRVKVRSGAFIGVEGVVIKRFNETRLLVAVDFLKQGVSVQIEDCQLERID